MAFTYKLEQEDGTPDAPPTPRRPSPRGVGDAVPLATNER
jgi:hypothetical protein